jgi:polysaccharide biosynthesis protein PslH
MRLLLVCPDSPCPPRDGGALRIVNLARSLARHTAVMLVTYVVSPAETEALTEFGRQFGIRVCGVPRPARRNVWTRAWHKFRHYYGPYLFSTIPGAVRFNQQPVMREALVKALQDFAPDGIIWEYWFMTGFAELAHAACPQAIQITDAIDLEWLRLQREAQIRGGVTKHWTQYIQPRVRRYTLDQYRRMAGVLFLSKTDAQLAQLDLPKFDRGFVVPMGLMLNEYPVPSSPPPSERLLFFGSFRHQPNVDALRFLLHNIWPLIQHERPQATLDLMGSGLPDWPRQYPNVRVLGFRPDIRPTLAEASVVIAPLRFGSGVKIKILESMAFGKAVITTPIGAEGIEAEPGTDFIVAADAQALASETIRLLANPSIRASLGQHARQFVQAHHDADQIAKNFLARLNELGTNRELAH